MIRQHFIDHAKMNRDPIQWRGHEVLRIEAFSDAVFAFAVTLLIVALEVPENFDELHETFLGFFGFGLGFLLLFQVWFTQNIFFRRYGLHDFRTIVLNGMLLFTALFFVYPLKFLASFLTRGITYTHHGEVHERITTAQIPELMIIYGLGFVTIFLLFGLMYHNALRKREHLSLSPAEVFETQTQVYRNGAFVGVGLLCVLLAMVLPAEWAGPTGILYGLTGPAVSIIHARRGRKAKLLFGAEETKPVE